MSSTNGTNGHINGNGKHAAEPPDRAVRAVEIFRPELSVPAHVRSLSETYFGFFTHYIGKRSQACLGEKCRYPCAKLEKHWKGYFAAEVWNEAIERWQPWVMELTETGELDVRGQFARGQVWEFWRIPSGNGKNPPLQGKLLETRDPKKFPLAFDVVSPLKTLYHVFELPAYCKNPLPPRVLVEDSIDDGPAVLENGKFKPPTPEETAKAREMYQRFTGKRKSPTEAKPK